MSKSELEKMIVAFSNVETNPIVPKNRFVFYVAFCQERDAVTFTKPRSPVFRYSLYEGVYADVGQAEWIAYAITVSEAQWLAFRAALSYGAREIGAAA